MIALKLIPIHIKIAILLALSGILLGSGFYAGKKWTMADWNKEKVQLLQAQAKADKKKQIEYDDLSGRLQAALQSVEIVERVVNRNIIREVEKPVYRDCIVPETGTGLINKSTDQLNGTRIGPLP